MRFLRPDYGWWLLGALAVMLVIQWRRRKRYAASTTVGWINGANRASWLRRLPFVALAAAITLAGLGAMQPILPFAEADVKSHGLDLVMVLDLSTSMLEPLGMRAAAQTMGPIVEGSTASAPRPIPKTRLEAVKDAIKRFVARRGEDRLGLVVFSDNAYIVSPLSADHDYLRQYVDMVDDQILRGEGMTAVGEGLALANYLLTRQTVAGDSRGRVVVLFTDGETNRGRDPVVVLSQSDVARIRVHIVGVDIEAKVRQKPEVERLVSAVRGYGGRYFDANTVADLNAASRVIDGLEKGTLTSKVYVRDVPVFHWFVIPALACLALTLALGTLPPLHRPDLAMIPDHVMRELRYLEVYSAKKIRNLRVGAHTSRLRGTGFDFQELRLYRPGDDVRTIDWSVTARMNAPYVRETRAERELDVMIALDVSRSMELGTSHTSKKESLAVITASLLFSALSDQVNTGFLAFADGVIDYSPPRRARADAWAILERFWALAPQPGRTTIVPAVRALVSKLKRLTVVFLVSDFMTDEDPFAGSDLSVLAARHDVIAVVPEDPAETSLPAGLGYLRVRDLESGQVATVGLGRRARAGYAERARQRRETLTQAFYRVPMDHVFVRTDQNPVEQMLSLFATRVRA